MHANTARRPTEPPGAAPNARRLLWAGFMAILAAGVGFAIRGGILDNWREEFGFSALQVGQITGGGLTGFCFGIMLGGLVVDKLGYGKLVALALLGHILSAVVTLSASSGDTASSTGTAYQFLFWGSFIFAFANGTLEAVANPLVATVFPHNRTHYLNILHASWPAGMILGALVGWFLDDRLGVHWKWQLALYLIPTAIYALMFLGQKFPQSEAAAKGASFVDMFRSVGILGAAVACSLLALFFADILRGFIPEQAAVAGYTLGGLLLLAVAFMTKFSIGSLMLFVLFVTHALVGAVELGTDSWIQNITGNLFSSQQGKALFIWTSTIMFLLRFCADFIETRLRLSPIGLLFLSAVLAWLGLRMASGMTTFTVALAGLGIYAVGKTFFWPTMLAVVGDRFPQTGAVAMSIMGGIGMLSAGLIGGPGLGYCKDRFAGEALQRADMAVYEQFKAERPSRFLDLPSTEAFGLDGQKIATAREAGAAATPEQRLALAADQQGDRDTLAIDSFIPATMAAIYLGLLAFFAASGGYRRVEMSD
jgi:MFS family permease